MAFNGKYDPQTLDDLVIEPNNKWVLEMMVKGLLNDHLILEGTNGTAKSTIAKLLPGLKHGQNYDIEHVKAHSGLVIDQWLLDQWQNIQAWSRVAGRAQYIMIDEIDTLGNHLSLFWQWLDEWRGHVTLIGTTNKVMAIPRALRSRAKVLTLKPVKAVDMLPRARFIMKSEGLDVSESFLLSELESVESLGDIRKYMERLECVYLNLCAGNLATPTPTLSNKRPKMRRVK
jgi:replication-associated recombination protein RarA